MEDFAIFIIIYAVFLIGESPTKKKPVVDYDPWDSSWRCGECIVDDGQKVDD